MRLPKWAVPLAGGLIVAGALGSREWNDVKERETARADAVASEQAAVRITARLEGCPDPLRPVRVTVKNTALRPLKAVTFHLGVYQPGQLGDRDPRSADQKWIVALASRAEESRCSAVTVPVGPDTVFKAEKRGAAIFEAHGKGVR